MDNSLFEKLEKFIDENRGNNVFRGQDIKKELVCYLLNDTCIYIENDNEIVGILCYEYTEYFPLTITIREILTTNNGVMVKLLEQMAKHISTPNVIVLASRKLSTKIVEYKNPRRLLKLIQRLYGSRRRSTTSI